MRYARCRHDVNGVFLPVFVAVRPGAQVTSSCSSVYVDGSEIRGSSNATVIVRYETYTGTAHFIVWVPEINEMDLTIADQKLNQIKGWRVPVSLEADDEMDE